MNVFLELLLCLTAVRGTVRDARTCEPLAIVAVQVMESQAKTMTDGSGRFDLGTIEPGKYTLKLSTVGYRLLQTQIEVKDGQAGELTLALSPDTFARTDRVEVRADPFDLTRQSGATEFGLDGSE